MSTFKDVFITQYPSNAAGGFNLNKSEVLPRLPKYAVKKFHNSF